MSDDQHAISADCVEPEKEADPFTVQGVYKDEVELLFDDGRKLYVPQLFLTMSSPVFEAMINSDFKERQDMQVSMKGKELEDVLNCFLCLHPRLLKSIDEYNVLRIAPIAEEYQVTPLVKTCKSYMQKWLSSLFDSARGISWSAPENISKMLEIVNLAIELNYDEVFLHALPLLARIPHGLYERFTPDAITTNSRYELQKVTECRRLYAKLPVEKRYLILTGRLAHFNQIEFK